MLKPVRKLFDGNKRQITHVRQLGFIVCDTSLARSDAVIGPTISTIYCFGGQRFSLFGTIAQFSTVTDVTLDDMKIELFFPADDQNAKFPRDLAQVATN